MPKHGGPGLTAHAIVGELQVNHPTLAGCLKILGPQVLHAVCTPKGTDIPFGTLVVAGSGETIPSTPGGILLAVGDRKGLNETSDIVRSAGKNQFSAIIIKAHGEDLAKLTPVAVEAGVALLVATDDMPWRHLDSLLTAAVSSIPRSSRQYSAVGIGDLFALANAIASSVGGAVTIEDPHGQVLAYSNVPGQEIDERRKLAILGRQTPDREGNAAEYNRIFRAAGRAVHFALPESPELIPRLAVAVRAGAEGLGVIFVLDGLPALRTGAADALEDAAKVTALHLLRSGKHRDPERQQKAEAMRALIDGAVSAHIAAVQMGINIDTSTVVLAIAVSRADPVPVVVSARIMDVVSLHCSAWHPDAQCTAADDVVYALLPTLDVEESEHWVRKFASDVAKSLKRSAQLTITVAIGSVAGRLDEVPTSRRLADQVLGVLANETSPLKIAAVDDVRSKVVLLELANRNAAHLRQLPGPLETIVDYDEEHGTPYAETVLAFLDAFGDASEAAQMLSIHENTLRYRLRRLQELLPGFLADPDDRLIVWLQLRLRDLVRKPADR